MWVVLPKHLSHTVAVNDAALKSGGSVSSRIELVRLANYQLGTKATHLVSLDFRTVQYQYTYAGRRTGSGTSLPHFVGVVRAAPFQRDTGVAYGRQTAEVVPQALPLTLQCLVFRQVQQLPQGSIEAPCGHATKSQRDDCAS